MNDVIQITAAQELANTEMGVRLPSRGVTHRVDYTRSNPCFWINLDELIIPKNRIRYS